MYFVVIHSKGGEKKINEYSHNNHHRHFVVRLTVRGVVVLAQELFGLVGARFDFGRGVAQGVVDAQGVHAPQVVHQRRRRPAPLDSIGYQLTPAVRKAAAGRSWTPAGGLVADPLRVREARFDEQGGRLRLD